MTSLDVSAAMKAARNVLAGKTVDQLNQLGLNRYRTNENKEPIQIMTGLTEMTEPKTCSTCHWWFRFSDDEDWWGKCVWHNGVKSTTVQQLRARGTIETRDDFGCVRHEEDKGQCREQS